MEIDDQKYKNLFEKFRSNKKYETISDSELGEIIITILERLDRENNENNRIFELKRKAEENTLTPTEAEELEMLYYENIDEEE